MRHGVAPTGKVRLGVVRRGSAARGGVWFGQARRGLAPQGLVWRGVAGPVWNGVVGSGGARPGEERSGRVSFYKEVLL